jgi:hypothetical protein
MSEQLPRALVQAVPGHWRAESDIVRWPWTEIAPLPPFRLASGKGEASWQTAVRLCADRTRLYICYQCHDPDIWGTLTTRDSAIYDEEVVELFIAPGQGVPSFYYEFEVSPLGVMLDLTVANPTGDRSAMQINTGWDCPGLRWQVERHDDAQQWSAYLSVPWASIGAQQDTVPPTWRANFYRIERPRGAEPEFSCWSPTMSEPADYHRPRYFGYITVADEARA